VFGGGQADVDVGAEGPGDLRTQQLPHRGAGDAADHLPDEEAERVDVVAVAGAGHGRG
jgi:hypothetical protein